MILKMINGDILLREENILFYEEKREYRAVEAFIFNLLFLLCQK